MVSVWTTSPGNRVRSAPQRHLFLPASVACPRGATWPLNGILFVTKTWAFVETLQVASFFCFKIIVSLRPCLGCARNVSSVALFACSVPLGCGGDCAAAVSMPGAAPPPPPQSATKDTPPLAPVGAQSWAFTPSARLTAAGALIMWGMGRFLYSWSLGAWPGAGGPPKIPGIPGAQLRPRWSAAVRGWRARHVPAHVWRDISEEVLEQSPGHHDRISAGETALPRIPAAVPSRLQGSWGSCGRRSDSQQQASSVTSAANCAAQTGRNARRRTPHTAARRRAGQTDGTNRCVPPASAGGGGGRPARPSPAPQTPDAPSPPTPLPPWRTAQAQGCHKRIIWHEMWQPQRKISIGMYLRPRMPLFLLLLPLLSCVPFWQNSICRRN
eukprot:gene9615-biopygen21250